jgi:transposase-like protein
MLSYIKMLTDAVDLAINGKEYERQKKLERQKEYKRVKKNLSLTCKRCGKLAEPISGTRRRYKCSSCGHQFASAEHNLPEG